MGAIPEKDGLFALFYDSHGGFYSKCCNSINEIRILKEDSTEKWSWKGLGYHDIGRAIKYPPITENGLIIGVYNRNIDSHLTRMANDISIMFNERRGIGGCLTIYHDLKGL